MPGLVERGTQFALVGKLRSWHVPMGDAERLRTPGVLIREIQGMLDE